MNQSQNMILLKSYHEAEILLKSILDKLETVKDRSTENNNNNYSKLAWSLFK